MSALIHDPAFWVAVSFVSFVIIAIFMGLPRKLTNSLDARATGIASEIEEARKLRAEAEQVLADYRRRQAEVMKETAAILEKTRGDAAQILSNAQADLQSALEKRSRSAMEKIAQAETKAVEEVQNHMVDVAISAARAIMQSTLTKGGGNEILKGAAAEIERKLH